MSALYDFFSNSPILVGAVIGVVIAGLVIAVWWAASSVVGALRHGRTDTEPRPRRRLPLR